MVEKKRIKLRTRFFISLSVGIIALFIAFSVSMSNPTGDTPDKIKEVEMAIEKICQGIGEKEKKEFDDGTTLDLVNLGPIWEKIEGISSPLVYKNQKIAKAKALLQYQENPIPDGSWDKYLWESRYVISDKDWNVQTIGARVLSSIGIAALWCVGCMIVGLLTLTIMPWLWYFLLDRISELSQAIQGK